MVLSDVWLQQPNKETFFPNIYIRNTIGECNTILNAYTMYKHLG